MNKFISALIFIPLFATSLFAIDIKHSLSLGLGAEFGTRTIRNFTNKFDITSASGLVNVSYKAFISPTPEFGINIAPFISIDQGFDSTLYVDGYYTMDLRASGGTFTDITLGFLLGYDFGTPRFYTGLGYVAHFIYLSNFINKNGGVYSYSIKEHDYQNGLAVYLGSQLDFTKHLGMGIDVIFNPMFIKSYEKSSALNTKFLLSIVYTF